MYNVNCTSMSSIYYHMKYQLPPKITNNFLNINEKKLTNVIIFGSIWKPVVLKLITFIILIIFWNIYSIC